MIPGFEIKKKFHFEKGITQEMDMILPRFYRGPRLHPTSGLNHLTKDDACECYACSFKRRNYY